MNRIFGLFQSIISCCFDDEFPNTTHTLGSAFDELLLHASLSARWIRFDVQCAYKRHFPENLFLAECAAFIITLIHSCVACVSYKIAATSTLVMLNEQSAHIYTWTLNMRNDATSFCAHQVIPQLLLMPFVPIEQHYTYAFDFNSFLFSQSLPLPVGAFGRSTKSLPNTKLSTKILWIKMPLLPCAGPRFSYVSIRDSANSYYRS